MTARELYEEAAKMFPQAGLIYTNQTLSTLKGGKVKDYWAVGVSSTMPENFSEETCTGYDIAFVHADTPDECLRKLREDGGRKAREGK